MERPTGKRFVFVTWKDSMGDPNNMTEEEMPHAPLLVTTAGWLMKEDDAGISLFSEWVSNETGKSYVFIVRELITDITEVRIPQHAKPRRSQEVPSRDVHQVEQPDRQKRC